MHLSKNTVTGTEKSSASTVPRWVETSGAPVSVRELGLIVGFLTVLAEMMYLTEDFFLRPLTAKRP
jgi:hypothetical protein